MYLDFFLLQISGKGKNTEADSHLNFGDKSRLTTSPAHESLGAFDTD